MSHARPVFPGTLTAILGVAPRLFAHFFRSKAWTSLLGPGFAPALTLVVVPLL